ncbi:Uncharacterized protein OBRU01_17246, partial [Operophtera brumata]
MADPNEDGKVLHLDAVLGQLGAFGKHQVTTLLMLALVYATNSMYNINYVFAVEDSEGTVKQCSYHPADPGCSTFSNESVVCQEWVYEVPDSFVAESCPVSWLNQSEGTVKQCSYHPADPGCSTFSNESVACQEWVYKLPDSFVAESFPVSWLNQSEGTVKQCSFHPADPGCSTFSNESVACQEWFGLACDDWKQTLVGTVHSFGNMLGQLVQGQLSDRYRNSGKETSCPYTDDSLELLHLWSHHHAVHRLGLPLLEDLPKGHIRTYSPH